jgi:hypothetical protein
MNCDQLPKMARETRIWRKYRLSCSRECEPETGFPCALHLQNSRYRSMAVAKISAIFAGGLNTGTAIEICTHSPMRRLALHFIHYLTVAA